MIFDAEHIRLTIRETTRHVLPWSTPQMIHHWLAQDIFRPVEYIPGLEGRGPGKGCKLDFYDLVWAFILTSLFAWGARFGNLRVAGGSVSETSLSYEKSGFSRDEIASLEQAQNKGRQFQEFLRLTKCKSLLWAERKRIVASKSVSGMTLTDPKLALSAGTTLLITVVRQDQDKAVNAYYAHTREVRQALGQLFINCMESEYYVETRLRLMP